MPRRGGKKSPGRNLHKGGNEEATSLGDIVAAPLTSLEIAEGSYQRNIARKAMALEEEKERQRLWELQRSELGGCLRAASGHMRSYRIAVFAIELILNAVASVVLPLVLGSGGDDSESAYEDGDAASQSNLSSINVDEFPNIFWSPGAQVARPLMALLVTNYRRNREGFDECGMRDFCFFLECDAENGHFLSEKGPNLCKCPECWLWWYAGQLDDFERIARCDRCKISGVARTAAVVRLRDVIERVPMWHLFFRMRCAMDAWRAHIAVAARGSGGGGGGGFDDAADDDFEELISERITALSCRHASRIMQSELEDETMAPGLGRGPII